MKRNPMKQEGKKLIKSLSNMRTMVEHLYTTTNRVLYARRIRVTALVKRKVRMTFVCAPQPPFEHRNQLRRERDRTTEEERSGGMEEGECDTMMANDMSTRGRRKDSGVKP